MKVLYIGGDSLPTGASFSMEKLIEEEEKLGIEVIPVVHEGNTEQLLNKKGKKHYVVNSWSWMVGNNYSRMKVLIYRIIKSFLNIPCYYQYKKIIKKENPDIVHINAITTYVGLKAAIKLKKRTVWHIRELLEEDLNGRFWSKKQAYRLMGKTDYFIAISKCVEEKYKKIVGSKRISCIYNGIDTNLFYNEKHRILINDKIIITMAGRLTKEKGQSLCLDALAPLLNENSNIVLQFAGEGDKEVIDEIIHIKNKYNLGDNRVKLLGFINDMASLWSETDIAIVYSKCEAFGRVTIEAKMAGALVVGYDSGGTTELIEDGLDGYLFNDSKVLLYDVVKNCILNADESRKVAERGRDLASKKFTSENNAKQVYKLYQNILKK